MAVPVRLRWNWQLRNRTVRLGARTVLMGILNITPDSFSDGGQFVQVEDAISRACTLLDSGADVVDLGGESTRPGASAISPSEELARIMPVLRGLMRRRPDALVSVDTYHSETAQAALDGGAEIVNDVSGGLWDPAMLPLCARHACGLVLMHTRGRPEEWKGLPPVPSSEIAPLVHRELKQRAREALAAGVARDSVVLDPGFGFGKTLDENYPLLARFGDFHELGFPLLAGVSRKGFLRRAIEQFEPRGVPEDALRDGTAAANVAAILAGAHILRVHDVASARHAAAIADSILRAADELSPPQAVAISDGQWLP
ncbi:MAG: dihydropteroate synthase [Acidobacteriota bacterium]|nr:dihydropteroate synthase [Acidobacteriota bacterium]